MQFVGSYYIGRSIRLLFLWAFFACSRVTLNFTFTFTFTFTSPFPNETRFTEIHILDRNGTTGWPRARRFMDRLGLRGRNSRPWDQSASFTICTASYPGIRRSRCGTINQFSSRTNLKELANVRLPSKPGIESTT